MTTPQSVVGPIEYPQERLTRRGSAALTDAELLSVLLSNGRKCPAHLAQAQEILEHSHGLAGLAPADLTAVRRVRVSKSALARLEAALEMARRLARASITHRTPLRDPAAIAAYLTLRYTATDQEIVGALYLDARHHLLAERELYRGTLTRTAAEPRVILREALLSGAAGFVLFHNHPGGDTSPSDEDILFTKRLAKAGALMGIDLLDHIILARTGRWTSLRRRMTV